MKVIVEPGAVVTEMSGRGAATVDRLAAGMTRDQHERYDSLIGAITTQSAAFTRDGVPAAQAARVIAGAITNKNPKTRYTIGRDAAIIVRLARFAPDRLLDRILRRNLRPHYTARDVDRPTVAA